MELDVPQIKYIPDKRSRTVRICCNCRPKDDGRDKTLCPLHGPVQIIDLCWPPAPTVVARITIGIQKSGHSYRRTLATICRRLYQAGNLKAEFVKTVLMWMSVKQFFAYSHDFIMNWGEATLPLATAMTRLARLYTNYPQLMA